MRPHQRASSSSASANSSILMSVCLPSGRAYGRVGLPMNHFPSAEPARSVDHCSPQGGVVQCPECGATSPTVAALSQHFVSLHCVNCGEVWLVRERRSLPGVGSSR